LTIAVIPGDGVGQEVIPEALRVLGRVESLRRGQKHNRSTEKTLRTR
jgi:isocitrate/isopropylmalate dehydrogenase